MINIRVERGWSFRGYQGWLIDYRNGETYVAKPMVLEFEKILSQGVLPEPTFKVDAYLGDELLREMKKSLTGLTLFDDKEDYEVQKRVEKAMQAHIDSLKMTVEKLL